VPCGSTVVTAAGTLVSCVPAHCGPDVSPHNEWGVCTITSALVAVLEGFKVQSFIAVIAKTMDIAKSAITWGITRCTRSVDTTGQERFHTLSQQSIPHTSLPTIATVMAVVCEAFTEFVSSALFAPTLISVLNVTMLETTQITLSTDSTLQRHSLLLSQHRSTRRTSLATIATVMAVVCKVSKEFVSSAVSVPTLISVFDAMTREDIFQIIRSTDSTLRRLFLLLSQQLVHPVTGGSGVHCVAERRGIVDLIYCFWSRCCPWR
jgi:hypothetical protein